MTNAIAEAIETIIETSATPKKAAPKKAAAKKAKRPVKPVKTEATPKPERNVKPEPVLYKTFELAEGVDPKAVEAAAKAAQVALDAITGTESKLVASYLALGQFQSEAAPMFKSSKLYGQFLKDELPASQSLDPALRSNCKWVYEAMNKEGNEASDILTVLEVNRIEDFKSGNPTVIRRTYKAAKAEADKTAKLQAKAEEAGVDVSEAEALMQSEAEAQAKKDQATAKRKLTALEKRIRTFLMQHDNIDDMADEATTLIREILDTEAKEQIAFLENTV